jgi:NADPH-dependent F420 reductase
MAARLASVGVDVVVGSRSEERATEACEEIRKRWPEMELSLSPRTNEQAARAALVIVATPWDAASATAAGVADELAGKVVVSMANALTKVDGELLPLTPPDGSVAAGVQKAVPDAMVAAAFHHLPARSLADLSRPVRGDVLICSDHPEAADATARLVGRVPDLRAVHVGSLASAAAVEAFTAVLLQVNARYRARAALRLTGLKA